MSLIIQNLSIEGLTINGGIPAMARAMLSALMEPDVEPVPNAPTVAGRPPIGEYWPGQGGIYAGDFRGSDGVVFGQIIGREEDIGTARWAPDGTRLTSDWDGAENTRLLLSDCPAAKLAARYTADGHADFYLPAQRELQFACANVRHLFGESGWYWSSTSRGESYAWAVDFEDGYTILSRRSTEFRVRPFRRFIY